ncbi:protein terminal ear1 homolog [Juglans regia]|uniref:Protein terminal ear1 homolog n=2 Tax=Juglans regia TaxID=51240 RepID=A0A2I4E7E5_JUGRE|nr:protein terminal ear1 homolog [Juglans regia]
MSHSPELRRSSSMDGLVSLGGLNPDAPVFMPNLYPQFTLYPIFPTPRHYYLSHLTSHFCYHNPYIQSFSWPALYTDTYFQGTGFPPQPENMPAVEATTPSVTAPSEQTNKMHRVSSVDQRAAVQKVNLGKYGTPSCRGRGGAWVRQAWSTKCGNGGNIGRRNAGNLNGYTRKADSLNTRGRSCARDEKKKSSPVLPVHCGVGKTTIMIRNIPSKYTRKMLVEFLDEHCKLENEKVETEEQIVSAFNFVYLPIDFSTGCNKGYAFVNFTDPRAVWKFYLAANNQSWELFHSNKIRQIAFARLQGEELVRHFESMGFPCESDEVLPVSFNPPRDGSRDFVKQSIVGRCIRTGPRGHRHERVR